MNIFFRILFALSAVLISCECVTNLDTPKIISPDDYSEAIIINVLPDRESLTIETNDIPIYEKADYTTPYPKYRKINSGLSYLRVYDDFTKLYLINLPIELNKFGKYSIFLYGYRNTVKTLIIEDSIKNINMSLTALYRFVHISFDTQTLNFIIKSKDSLRYELNFRSFTALKSIPIGNYDIEIRNPINNQLIAYQNNYQVKANYLYNFILKGTSTTLPNKPIELEIISSELVN